MNKFGKLHIPYDAPLNELDTETQTAGCRAVHPDRCANNRMPNVCAFASADGICRKPPRRTWVKKYNELKLAQESNNT